MTKMFTLAGDTPEQAAKEAEAVMKIETALAKVSTAAGRSARSREAIPHLHGRRFPEAGAGFRFSAYFKDVKVGHFDTLNVATPDFFKGLNELIASQPVDAWKSYLRWHVTHGVGR